MTKTDIATSRRILALLQADDADTALARWDKSYRGKDIHTVNVDYVDDKIK